MSAAATAVAPVPGARVPMGRLVHVELRKLVDTRSGFWLLAVIALLTVAVDVTFVIVADPADIKYEDLVGATALPQAVLLPVLGILTVTSEWGQRTALTTFTLEPRRIRIAVAKLIAAVILGLAAVAVAMAVAAVTNLVGMAVRDGDGSWNFGPADLRDAVVLQLLGVVQGLAFGMLIMITAAAIVAYYLLPNAWGILVNLVPGLEDAAPWLDLGTATEPLLDPEQTTNATDWARIAVTATIWVVVPLVLGMLRLMRREVKSA